MAEKRKPESSPGDDAEKRETKASCLDEDAKDDIGGNDDSNGSEGMTFVTEGSEGVTLENAPPSSPITPPGARQRALDAALEAALDAAYKAADAALQVNISAEETRATAAEQANATAISNIIGTSPENLNSLTELVVAYTNMDSAQSDLLVALSADVAEIRSELDQLLNI